MQTNIHIRGVSKELINTLKKTAVSKKTSVNKLILNLLNSSLGITQNYVRSSHHDLDNLAGTWSKNEAKEFLSNTASFEQIDKDLWK